MSPVPSDPAGHDDNVLMAEISALNEQLGQYVLRFLAADTLQAEPMSPQVERDLADQVAKVADGMLTRAVQRELEGDPAPLIQSCSSDEQP